MCISIDDFETICSGDVILIKGNIHYVNPYKEDIELLVLKNSKGLVKCLHSDSFNNPQGSTITDSPFAGRQYFSWTYGSVIKIVSRGTEYYRKLGAATDND